MAIVPRWHFDPTLGRCLQFEYGGCEGNENNFATERECHHRCIRSEDDYITIPDNERTGIVITENPRPVTDPKPDPIERGMYYLDKIFRHRILKSFIWYRILFGCNYTKVFSEILLFGPIKGRGK